MKIIVTGGAGFIGCNVTAAWARRGHELVVIDNLSRLGARQHLDWLRSQGAFSFYQRDVRHYDAIAAVMKEHRDADAVVHLAAQVAVTTSVVEPLADFEHNALGTLNVLESVRQHCPNAALLFASTNKVYGSLPNVAVEEGAERLELVDRPFGIAEDEPLDFHSPYGCSKGAADQYVLDYARIYGLRTVSLRQSCIYGTRQLGTEDQGWVAWLTIAAQFGRVVTLYGDGKQVRDVLFIDDLFELYDACIANIDRVAGNAYNVGGGPHNRLSLLELIAELEARLGTKVRRDFAPLRPGDQPVFVADIRKAARDLGWEPRISVEHGVGLLFDWVAGHRSLFDGTSSGRAA